jgi:hypothetical protein
MDPAKREALEAIAGELRRLQGDAVSIGEDMLAYLLAVALDEAENSLGKPSTHL